MIAEDLEVFIVTPENPPNGWERWMGTLAWAGDSLFVPIGALGLSYETALLMCGFDSEPLVECGHATLVREDWARRVMPGKAAVIDLIREAALKADRSA